MTEEAFRKIVEEEWDKVPSPHRDRITNVALLVEDEPSDEVRKAEGLADEDTLLGIYQGVPLAERGAEYGVGATLPDTITVYRMPTLLEAEDLHHEAPEQDLTDLVRQVVRETIWHEVGHYFGYDEDHIQGREGEGSNTYGQQ